MTEGGVLDRFNRQDPYRTPNHKHRELGSISCLKEHLSVGVFSLLFYGTEMYCAGSAKINMSVMECYCLCWITVVFSRLPLGCITNHALDLLLVSHF